MVDLRVPQTKPRMLFQSHESNFEILNLQTWDRHISKLSRASIVHSEINIKVNFCPKTQEYWILYVKRLVDKEKTKKFYIGNSFENVNVMANTQHARQPRLRLRLLRLRLLSFFSMFWFANIHFCWLFQPIKFEFW